MTRAHRLGSTALLAAGALLVVAGTAFAAPAQEAHAAGVRISAQASPPPAAPAQLPPPRLASGDQEVPLQPPAPLSTDLKPGAKGGAAPKAVQPRAGNPVTDIISSLIDIFEKLVDIIQKALEKPDRGSFVQAVVNDTAARTGGHYNIMLVADDARFDASFAHTVWDGHIKYKDGQLFRLFIFDSGHFTLRSDGGWSNWGFYGRFSRSSSGELTFYKSPGDSMRSAAADSKCVDDQQGGLGNGNPIQIYDCNTTDPQWWYRDGQALKVTISGVTKCLDAGGGGWTDKVQLWDCNGTPPQQWSYDNGALRNAKWQYCLDVPNSNLGNGNRLQMYPCNDSSTQHFTLP
ncbi:ricin-type beta-trefoil lectin domain protein [Streptomyces sp. Y1]|uniref:Ricin-type beta-trefoil lectin domain protein n=1 Tax=Streptomyces sp. Y1 TaxID=3238634 RepID=A0AB39TVD8_9ACTN